VGRKTFTEGGVTDDVGDHNDRGRQKADHDALGRGAPGGPPMTSGDSSAKEQAHRGNQEYRLPGAFSLIPQDETCVQRGGGDHEADEKSITKRSPMEQCRSTWDNRWRDVFYSVHVGFSAVSLG
jgi:hypothetical protein